MIVRRQKIAKETATSTLNVHPSFHARSNSLPSRQHSIASQIDEDLNQLRASDQSATTSSIGHQLNYLQDLYDSVDMLLQLPLSTISSSRAAKEMGIANEVRKYLTSRKAVRKAICKGVEGIVNENLKHMENKLSSSSFSYDDETIAVINNLKQVKTVTISVLESMLSFISGPEAESKSSRWSLVSKCMHQKRVACKEEQKPNEIAKAESTLRSLIKSGNMKHVENVQNELQNSEMCIQDLDEGLESFFRRLIKARVTVINILNC
ncbi:putative Eukaryotic translation initiation factor 3 subunit A [Hibiscus syriacus]|uniref:Eukaryotic translation initiation factor 3 subunit A n=1 Tax=Hibiscus syriacus TaxID=106335 RepID=A0A6A2X068_HIBSY|nr:putative Eukaryotic translation initiation factor 3 subunit A [Hibiscus syriacus]